MDDRAPVTRSSALSTHDRLQLAEVAVSLGAGHRHLADLESITPATGPAT
jgi:hypothetical protein